MESISDTQIQEDEALSKYFLLPNNFAFLFDQSKIMLIEFLSI